MKRGKFCVEFQELTLLFSAITKKVITIQPGKEGFYNIHFVKCVPDPISFEVQHFPFAHKLLTIPLAIFGSI
jgi:hypothetical protein